MSDAKKGVYSRRVEETKRLNRTTGMKTLESRTFMKKCMRNEKTWGTINRVIQLINEIMKLLYLCMAFN